jgi:hypothetical protein
MELLMFRKYVLIVTMAVAAMGVSAFSSVTYLPPLNTNVSIANGSSRLPALSVASSSIPEVVSQQYQYGPRLAATGFLGVARQYQYGPKSAATGILGVARQYQYGPKSAVTGFLGVARQYQYGPKSAITGFLASP